MVDMVLRFLSVPWIKAAAITVGSLLAAFVAEQIISRVVMRLARKTKTEIDDTIVGVLRRPIFYSVLLIGLAWAAAAMATPREDGAWFLSLGAKMVIYGVLKTIAVLTWAAAAMRISKTVLGAVSSKDKKGGVINPRTLPAFDILFKVLIFAGAVYFGLLAWHINLTGWLASAGVLGIILGLAAKDTLGNLFAGIFILADAPYKLGDFIQLDDLRGKVTDIGIRSTRILTRDDIEITIPNAVIGNSKIINETGGPSEKARVRINAFAAYGSDAETVIEVLSGCPEGIDLVCETPRPLVRFMEFGDSALRFELLVWIIEPMYRDEVIHQINRKIYDAFNAAEIEIPYSKHDIYIKEMAGRPPQG